MSYNKNVWKRTERSALNTVIDTAINAGKAAIHALSPDDFEYYLCSLELLDSSSERVGFLSFTVMPDQLVESHAPIQTLLKTHSAIVTTFNDGFSPINISLAGTFGKKLRVVSGMKKPNKKFSFLNFNGGKFLGDTGIKSGYGLIKVLEDILKTSNELDMRGRPHTLIFTNYAFNTSYVVNAQNFQFHQGYENNMIWYYSVNLVAVGNKSAVKKEGLKLLKTVGMNGIASGLTNIINNMINF